MIEKKHKDNIAFVCQRYGLEVNGGAELYCRQVAEHLLEYYNVTVFTTCAIDYVTWSNYYAEGEEDINGVIVRRFPVVKERNQQEFASIHGLVFNNARHTDKQEAEWVDKQGPVCPGLIEEIKKEYHMFKAVIFVTYLYYPAIKGLGLDLPNSILVPTVHDEPPVYLRCFDRVFKNAKGIAWNTPEERDFAYKRFPFIKRTPSVMTGIGVNLPTTSLPEIPKELKEERYIVYAGRIDESKGCREMFDFFLRYRQERNEKCKLVLMGKEVLTIPKHPDIIHLGFVEEDMKFAVMQKALALVLFSHFESLSIVVLESMLVGKPVLVTEKCDVLKGHCLRSNAGLYFDNYEEFRGELNYLIQHPKEYDQMCRNGREYVKENYQWDVIVGQYKRIIEHMNTDES